MLARVTRIQVQPETVDEVVRQVKEETVPLLEGQDGFKGFTMIVDRESGKVVGTSYWESSEALEASEAAVSESRERVAQTGGASHAPAVEHYEVAVDTMA